jgi:hypothetical protein
MKQRMEPIHKRREKPPNRLRQNFTHSGVVLGGVSWLGPSLRKISLALSTVRP